MRAFLATNRERRPRLYLATAALLATALLPVVVQANHPQANSVAPVVFDHIGGNEYWVEVRIKSTAAFHLVNWRHESGQFGDMSQSSWDPNTYVAGNQHIMPGERVQFQVFLEGPDGATDIVTSCYFTHPAGVEQCDPGATDDFHATFRNPGGNEWWEQVYIDPIRPVKYAYIYIFGMREHQDLFMEKKSWGAWAGNYYAPNGTVLQFVAVSGDEEARSACYKWPQVVVVACPGIASYTSAANTTFDHRTGNEWWVEVTIGPYEPQAVMARDDGGPWVTLTKRSWGAWANSFRIEPGHKVEFLASVNGGKYESCWFTHPQGLTPEGGQQCGNTYLGPA